MRVAVIAPSSYSDSESLDQGVSLLEDRGLEVFVHPQARLRWNQSAGTHEQKIQALHEVFSDSSIDAVFSACGGNRATHILDRIDYDVIRAHPKPIVGFSDITALLNAFVEKAGVQGIHGPMLNTLASGKHLGQLDFLLGLLAGDALEYPTAAMTVLRSGQARGPLLGGCLSVFLPILGTPCAPSLDGAILFLEDAGTEVSQLDRALLSLRRMGVLGRISGLLLGSFSRSEDTGIKPFGFSLEEIVLEHTEGLDIPVVINGPFGHGPENYALLVGGTADLEASRGGVAFRPGLFS